VDLKSPDRKIVSVQVRSRVPIIFQSQLKIWVDRFLSATQNIERHQIQLHHLLFYFTLKNKPFDIGPSLQFQKNELVGAAVDLKTPDRKIVSVQVRSRAPIIFQSQLKI